jgi:hypothetical protein
MMVVMMSVITTLLLIIITTPTIMPHPFCPACLTRGVDHGDGLSLVLVRLHGTEDATCMPHAHPHEKKRASASGPSRSWWPSSCGHALPPPICHDTASSPGSQSLQRTEPPLIISAPPQMRVVGLETHDDLPRMGALLACGPVLGFFFRLSITPELPALRPVTRKGALSSVIHVISPPSGRFARARRP